MGDVRHARREDVTLDKVIQLLNRASGEAWRLRHDESEAREYGDAVEFLARLGREPVSS